MCWGNSDMWSERVMANGMVKKGEIKKALCGIKYDEVQVMDWITVIPQGRRW